MPLVRARVMSPLRRFQHSIWIKPSCCDRLIKCVCLRRLRDAKPLGDFGFEPAVNMRVRVVLQQMCPSLAVMHNHYPASAGDRATRRLASDMATRVKKTRPCGFAKVGFLFKCYPWIKSHCWTTASISTACKAGQVG